MRNTVLAALLGSAIFAGCAKEAMPDRSPQEIATALSIEIDTTVASPGSEAGANDADTDNEKYKWKPAVMPIPTKL